MKLCILKSITITRQQVVLKQAPDPCTRCTHIFWLDNIFEALKAQANNASECDFNISIFDIIEQLCATHCISNPHSTDARSEVKRPLWSQIRQEQTHSQRVLLLWCLSAVLSRWFPHNRVWSLSSGPARCLAAESPQFHSSMHVDQIIHKASN